MDSASHHTRVPFPRSSSYPIPRPKTPHPGFERFHSDEQPKRARTPRPHEEDIRHHKRTISTSAWVAGQQYHRTADTRPEERPKIPAKPISHWAKYEDASFDPPEWQYLWDRRAYDIDTNVHHWMLEDEARRTTAARESARTRLIQEEVRRIEERICLKHDIERQQQVLEERRLAYEHKERVWARRQRAAAEKVITSAWEIYERNWAIILSTSDLLSFSSIPWPTLNKPLRPSSITPAAISAFLLSESHSGSRKPKDRIREALRRWHPDRFGRLMQRVPLEEKETIEEAVGVVARCLNELLSLYSE